MSSTIVEMMFSEIRENMEKYVADYQRNAANIARLASIRQFPSSFETDALNETTARAKGAESVLALLEVFGTDTVTIRPRLDHHMRTLVLGGSITTNQEIMPIFETLSYIDSADFLRAAGELDDDVVCGDYPAPCNCDDPSTHNGH